MANHPPEENGPPYCEKTTRNVPDSHQHGTDRDHGEADEQTLPGLCHHDGLPNGLTAAVVHQTPFTVGGTNVDL